MSFPEKAQHALELIKTHVDARMKPVVYSSFGKDSMVLLDLIKRAGFKFPIVFHREPYGGRRYEFADQVIKLEGYAVHDWPPSSMEFRSGADRAGKPIYEIVNRHTSGRVADDYLPIGVRDPEDGQPFFCGLVDFYGKPLGSGYTFPWDLGFVGLKSTDEDPMLGGVRLITDVDEDAQCPLVFPLRHFTDADIWAYTRFYQLPVNTGRYDLANGGREHHDITYNPDWFHVCVACMDAGESTTVHCPKVGREIPRVDKLIDTCRVTRPVYFEEQADA